MAELVERADETCKAEVARQILEVVGRHAEIEKLTLSERKHQLPTGLPVEVSAPR
jgi:hypothetical protein